jgi:hypothetical protein
MRAAAATLVSLAAAGLLAACAGKGGEKSTTAAQTSRVPTTTAPSAPAGSAPSKAAADAFARAVNLRAADVPGFKASARTPEHQSAAEKRLADKLRGCFGASGTKEVAAIAEAGSPEFKRALGPFSQTVSSNVSVATSSAGSARELKAMHALATRACVAHYFELLLKSKKLGHVTIAPVSVAAGAPPAPGTGGSFGWRFSSGLGIRGVEIPFTLDILGFVYGPAEVTLESFDLPRPLPASTEERLYTLLVQRATRHPLS